MTKTRDISRALRSLQSSRNILQEQQRQESRKKLLSAAKVVFKKKGYGATTVDDVLRSSNISRGTFYSHFSNKCAVVEALFEEIAPQLEDVFAQLGELPQLDQTSVEAWLERVLTIHRRHYQLFALLDEAGVLETTNLSDIRVRILETTIHRLSQKYNAFALTKTDTIEGKEMYFRFTALMSNIGFYCQTTVARGSPDFYKSGRKVMAEEVLRFIKLGIPSPS